MAVCQQPAAGGLPPVQGNGQTRGSGSPDAGVEAGGQRPLLRSVLSVVRVPAPVCSALPAAPAGPAIPPPLEGPPGSQLCAPPGRRAPAGMGVLHLAGVLLRSGEYENRNRVFTKWQVAVETKLAGF